jgi:hypothetical protein
MRILRFIKVVAAIIAIGLVLHFELPKLAHRLPSFKGLARELRSMGGATPGKVRDGDGGARSLETADAHGRTLTPEETQWLELKRRRYELLSEAVKPQ